MLGWLISPPSKWNGTSGWPGAAIVLTVVRSWCLVLPVMILVPMWVMRRFGKHVATPRVAIAFHTVLVMRSMAIGIVVHREGAVLMQILTSVVRTSIQRALR